MVACGATERGVKSRWNGNEVRARVSWGGRKWKTDQKFAFITALEELWMASTCGLNGNGMYACWVTTTFASLALRHAWHCQTSSFVVVLDYRTDKATTTYPLTHCAFSHMKNIVIGVKKREGKANWGRAETLIPRKKTLSVVVEVLVVNSTSFILFTKCGGVAEKKNNSREQEEKA